MNAPGSVRLPHRLDEPRRFRRSLDADFLFVFALFAVTLFTLQLKGLALFYLVLVAGYVALRPGQAAPALQRCAPILLLPFYALLSAMWSIAPAATLYHGVQYLLTAVAAILIGAATARDSALRGIVAAFLLWAVANLLYAIPQLVSGATFVGLSGSKNAAGDAAAVGVIVAVTMLLSALARRNALLFAAAAALLAIDGAIVLIARSAGAVIATGVGVIAVLAFSASRLMPVAARTVILVLTIAAAAAAAATMHLWSQELFQDLLAASGKNSTLTGRTYIWSRADVLIAQRPAFGLGYSAFWRVGSLEAEAIWRKLDILSRTGFHFHNTILDIVVHLGYVGLALTLLIFALYGAGLLWSTLRRPTSSGVFLVAVTLAYASRAEFEVYGYLAFSHSTLLLLAALAWSTRGGDPSPARRGGAARASRRGTSAGALRRPRPIRA